MCDAYFLKYEFFVNTSVHVYTDWVEACLYMALRECKSLGAPAFLFKKGATCYRIALLILAALEGGRGSAQPLRRTRLTGVSTFSCGGSMPVGVDTDAVWRLCS